MTPSLRILPADVKCHIKFHNHNDRLQPLGDTLLPYQALWISHFWRWMSGSGHVDHPFIKVFIPYDHHIGDPFFRTRSFLQYCTGAAVIPQDNRVIKVRTLFSYMFLVIERNTVLLSRRT